MRMIICLLLIAVSLAGHSQEIEKINIPKDVRYKYCEPAVYEAAKTLIRKELSDSPTYTLSTRMTYIGPALWARYKGIKEINDIKGGNVFIRGYKSEILPAKLTQNIKDFKLVWDRVRSEVRSDFILRKATYNELEYYWSVIQFDIEEPLIVIETKEHHYILELFADSLTLSEIEEIPKEKQ